MIERYQTPEMATLWSDEARLARWLEVELLATEGHAALDLVPADEAAACRERAPGIDGAFLAAVLEREEVTNHDVAAFVDVVQSSIGAPAGSWIHYGLTSSDVVDTALCWAMRDASDLIAAALRDLRSTLIDLAIEHRDTVMIGRTHGIHAEPTTFGAKVALWALQVDRDLRRLTAARDSVSVMKLSGAVGTYSNIPPEVEAHVGEALGLTPVPATQVVARDRHAELLYACASIAATCELVAVELRHLQRTEVREVLEGFAPGQKGSSAMPHKRNPISAETISGLARVVRSNLSAGLQDVALWHERDISHSSVERVILPDSTTLAHYLVRRLDRLVSRLEVFPERMRANLESSRGLVFSQAVLLALVSAGMTRDDAYRVVQSNAMRVWDEGGDFRTLLEQDEAVTGVAGEVDLDGAFDIGRSLKNAQKIFENLEAIQR
ncbi:MAG: adenylosuccinate lyase [Ilumatobacteraceae bacterium]